MNGYTCLKEGEVLQAGDEYSTSGLWRIIPDFMVGDIIPEADNTGWRRPQKENKSKAKIKHRRWFHK